MFDNVVIGFDGSDQGRDALALGRLLANPAKATITAACVYETRDIWAHPLFGDWLAEVRAEAERTLAGAGADVQKQTFDASSPARGLHNLAEYVKADLLVVGSCHRGPVGRVVAGSVAQGLLHGSPCAVAVAPRGFAGRERMALDLIGVGYDASEEARVALSAASQLAERAHARLLLVGVASLPRNSLGTGSLEGDRELIEARRAQLEQTLREALDPLPGAISAETSLVTGTTDVLGEDGLVDVLFLGSRGYGPLRRVLLGSTSARLIHHAECPVVVFPRGVAESAGLDRPAAAAATAD